VSRLVTSYRVLAYVVGLLLAFCSLVALPLKYLASEGSSAQQFGEDASILWVAHGWVFMIYLVVAFVLSRRCGWTLQFTILVLAAGLVPLIIFFVERVVMRKIAAADAGPTAT
jgi:integral membrane protein